MTPAVADVRSRPRPVRLVGVFLPLLAVAGFGVPAGAQQPTACYRGRPPSACRSFWITDATGGVQGFEGRTRAYAAVEVGWMRSVGGRSAVGAGLAGGYALDDPFVSLRPRYRRWVSSATALDGAVGVRWQPGRIEQVEAIAGVSWRDWGGVWGGVVGDVGRSRVGWMAGVKTSSYAGIASYVVGAIVGTIYAITTFPVD